MPTHLLDTGVGFADKRAALGGVTSGVAFTPNTPASSTRPVLATLAGTHTVANQFQCTGANSYLEVGQIVDIVSPAGTVRGSSRTITVISGTTTLTVTYSGADIGTDANGDLVLLAVGAQKVGAPGTYINPAALDAALTAANGTYFTTTKLDSMSFNDKVYAYRLIASPGSIT